MILFFTLLVIGIIAIAAPLTYAFLTDRPVHKVASTVGVLIGIVMVVAALGFHEIGAGTVGVVTSFGKIQGQVQPGLVWMPPIVNDVVIMDARVKPYNFGGDPNANPAGQGIEAFTKENQTARMYGVVNYHIDPQYAADLYQQVGVDYFEKVIQHQADTEIKRDARNYTTDEITAKRDELAAAAKDRLQEDVNPYHIVVDGVFISQIGLPQEYLDSVNNKLIAAQNALTASQNAESARQNAQGVADSNRITAQGQADANTSLSNSLTPELIQWQQIIKLNPNVQVIYLPTGSNYIVPLPSTAPAPAP